MYSNGRYCQNSRQILCLKAFVEYKCGKLVNLDLDLQIKIAGQDSGYIRKADQSLKTLCKCSAVQCYA